MWEEALIASSKITSSNQAIFYKLKMFLKKLLLANLFINPLLHGVILDLHPHGGDGIFLHQEYSACFAFGQDETVIGGVWRQ